MKENKEKNRSDIIKELRRYIEQTSEIRTLSSPQIRLMAGADSYMEELKQNFARIGELAKDNTRILKQYYYPRIEDEMELDEDALEEIRFFSNTLIDATGLNNMDAPLVYKQALWLMKKSENIDDDGARILALDGMVTASYLMICVSSRLMPMSDIVLQYYHVGLSAAEELLVYLDHDRFLALSTEMKELIVINARYIRVVSEIDGFSEGAEKRELNLQRMKDALALAEDPFYRDQLPDYNWDLHLFRTYEYISSFTDLNNMKGYEPEQLRYINECTKKMKALYESSAFDFKSHHHTQLYNLFVIRNAYLDGELDLAEYKSKLASMIFQDFREDLTDSVPLVMLLAPLEYILVLDKEHMSAEEESILNYFYTKLISYIHQTPKKDQLVFLLTCLSLILKDYIEIPGGMDLETMGLSLIVAMHPMTYVHTLSVADFAKMLTRHLLKKSPELFIGMPGYNSVEEVEKHRAEIEDYAYHASLCHDFGKLLITDTILTYGRDLLDDEFEFIHAHPAIGAHLLERHSSTAMYADVAHGHHKWFNDEGGYPETFSMTNSPYKTIVSIVACVDCLDAATDFVGRSYKEGKTLDQFLQELEEGSGTRYAPYLRELFDDPQVRAQTEYLLTSGREENYRKAYFILKKNAG